MITIAVLSVLVAIALPAYDNYVREGHFTAMRATLNGLRTPIEDFRLENGNYGTTGTLSGTSQISRTLYPSTGRFDWTPSGDTGVYTYTVVVTGTNSYDVLGQYGSGVWVRCENRYQNCCDADTAGSATPTNCP